MLKLGLTVFYASLQSHDLLFKRCNQCEKLFIADFLLNFCFFLFGTEILFLLFLHTSFDLISYFLNFYSRVGLSNQGDDLFVLVDEVIDKILLSGHPLVFGLQVGHFALLKFILIRGLFLQDVHGIENENYMENIFKNINQWSSDVKYFSLYQAILNCLQFYLQYQSSYLMNTSRSSSLTAKSSGISHSSSPKEVRKEKKINTGETKYRYGWIHRLIFRNQVYRVNGPQSEAFNRRTYEIPIEELKQIKNDNIGFTNHTLCKIEKNKVQLYVPVYLSLKIKSIQEISLSELLARIGCVLIVFINIQNLPQKLITHLSSHIMVQINRGASFLLAQTIQTGKISLKRDKKFLTFTIRDTFPVQIYEDVFLSPFEILNLVFTVTFNSTTIKLEEENLNAPPLLLRRTSNSANIETVSADNKTVKTVQHIVSFNCMRHPLKIPITYAQECKLGVYDLAEQLLDYYSTDKASYPEVIDCFEDFLQEKEKEEKNQKCSKAKNDKKGKESQKSLKEKGKKDKKAEKDEAAMIQNQVIYNFQVPQSRQPLVMKPVNKQDKKEKQASYFQYTHFVIPLYKFPGNAWATIFIPMFMLALLSIFIFLQTSTSVEEKLGSIATFVLGFIALVPNIKSELPPSQKISFSEIIVYIESINCMLSLLQQFPGASSLKKKPNIWKNPLFLVSITIHIICFASSLILLCLHYFVWQPRYNIKKVQPLSSPKTDYDSWRNPYCDEKFLKFNSDMRKNPSDITNQIFEWPLSNYDELVKAQNKAAEDKVKQSQETSLLKIEEKKVR